MKVRDFRFNSRKVSRITSAVTVFALQTSVKNEVNMINSIRDCYYTGEIPEASHVCKFASVISLKLDMFSCISQRTAFLHNCDVLVLCHEGACLVNKPQLCYGLLYCVLSQCHILIKCVEFLFSTVEQTRMTPQGNLEDMVIFTYQFYIWIFQEKETGGGGKCQGMYIHII